MSKRWSSVGEVPGCEGLPFCDHRGERQMSEGAKNWLKITILSEAALVDALTDFCVGIIGAGVEVDVEGHITKRVLTVWMEKENPSLQEQQHIEQQILGYGREIARIFDTAVPEMSCTMIEEQDWNAVWKAHFRPLAITENLVVVPSWESHEVDSDKMILTVDPGMAFGTGHHATTSLSLKLLSEIMDGENKPSSVLDVGCGTGILGMAAGLYGGEQILGIDNDSIAVAVARENVAQNNLSHVMEVSDRPVSQLTGTYQLVMANIVHDVLIAIAEDVKRLVEPGGRLILSGIVEGPQVASIKEEYLKHGFTAVQTEIVEEWAAVSMQKL